MYRLQKDFLHFSIWLHNPIFGYAAGRVMLVRKFEFQIAIRN